MKIGMVLDQEFPTDIRVENEAVKLVDDGFDVSLLSFNYGKKDKAEVYKGVKIYRHSINKQVKKKGKALINTPFDFFTTLMSKIIHDFVREKEIDVLHVHDLHLLGAALKAKKKCEFKLVSDLHENYVYALKNYRFSSTFPGNILISIKKWQKKEIEWVRLVDYLITVIEEAVDRYEKIGVDKNKIKVVANYVNRSDFLAPQLCDSIIQKYKGKFIVTYVGGFDIHRGLELVIKAMPLLIKEIPNLKLVLVGTGINQKSLTQMSKKFNVFDYISFEGWQAPQKLPSYIKASNVCLIPHLKTIHTDNTIPHKLFHYMLMEKPVVSTNCNPLKRIIQETKCGLIYEDGNIGEFVDNVKKIYNNKKISKNMGENGKKAVEEKYNWDKTSENLIELYKQLEKK